MITHIIVLIIVTWFCNTRRFWRPKMLYYELGGRGGGRGTLGNAQKKSIFFLWGVPLPRPCTRTRVDPRWILQPWRVHPARHLSSIALLCCHPRSPGEHLFTVSNTDCYLQSEKSMLLFLCFLVCLALFGICAVLHGIETIVMILCEGQEEFLAELTNQTKFPHFKWFGDILSPQYRYPSLA